MPNGDLRPLPFLPLPSPETVKRSRGRGGPSGIKSWGHSKQAERVQRQLQRLQFAFEARRQELRDELAGVEPELALVIETAGSIDRFHKAVAGISGLEWLAEYYEPEMEPGDDFYRTSEKAGEEGRERAFGGTVYLVMSDRRAQQEMLSLWRLYEKDDNARFPQPLTPWREAFKHVRTIRPWGPEDRLRETGLIEDWRGRLAWDSPTVRAQAELWFRHNEQARREQVRELRVRLRHLQGRLIGQEVVIPEIAYHGCLLEVPREVASDLVEGKEIELLRCEGVMFLRPVGQIAVPMPDEEPAAGVDVPPPQAVADQEPVVAVLDGMPIEGHDLLRGRLRVDDPDGWGSEIGTRDRHHGTAMTSLLLHGDLSAGQPTESLARPLYVRPLLRPQSAGPLGSHESMPEDILEIDLIHRAIRRIIEGEGGDGPAAPGTLIVNLSLGDPSRPLDRQISPLARLLDWLAWEHALLFVVSAGNPDCAARLQLDCSSKELRNMDGPELRRRVWKAIVKQAHLRRLLAPAESVNSITVGGEHADEVDSFELRNRIDPYGGGETSDRLPSPVTAFGTGVGRAIKPDLFYPAGRQLYRESYGTTESAELEIAQTSALPPGQRVASPGGVPGRADQTRYLCGTSNAAALASRAAARTFERLPDLLGDEPMERLSERRFVVPLLKALLLHAVQWGASQEMVEELLSTASDDERNIDRMTLGRYLGYGFPEEERLAGCHEQRATLYGWGELGDGDGHVYRIPLPSSLSGKKVWRRLTITLAWLTPINPFDQRYRRANLWFEPKNPGDIDSARPLGVMRTEADGRAATRGTVQHEVLEGESAAVFSDQEDLVVKVSCRAHAGELTESVPYGLAVSLEVAPGVELPIYEEIRARLRVRALVRT